MPKKLQLRPLTTEVLGELEWIRYARTAPAHQVERACALLAIGRRSTRSRCGSSLPFSSFCSVGCAGVMAAALMIR